MACSYFVTLRYGDCQENAQLAGMANKKQSKSLRQKGKTMKKWFLVCLICVTPWALADGHSDLGLEKRQPDTAMNVTSVKLGQDVTSVSAEGDMDGYGKVYVTYDLSYNAARNGGTVSTGKAVVLLQRAMRPAGFRGFGSWLMAS